MRDSIDFGTTKVSHLFRRLFIPTLLALLASVLLNLADGIFVGRGVGSDALAAINIAAPVFLISTGIALMMGSGVSVVAAIHMSRGNQKAANINVTQAFTVGTLLMAVILVLVNISPETTCMLFGGSPRLAPLVATYLQTVAVSMLLCVVLNIGMFVIRLDGSPKFAMVANVLTAMVNIFLDWLFVFPLGMGIAGAGIATSLSTVLGAMVVVWYFCGHSNKIRLYKPKFSPTALRLTMRNVGYITRLGLPTFIAETAMSCMMIVGNFMFMSRLHEEGVAAFSVACYLFPLVFMFGNAIAQTALPIVSYNHGQGDEQRVRQALRISLWLSVGAGLLMSAMGVALAPALVGLFLDSSLPAYAIGAHGLPIFALVCLFFTPNIVLIGYLQSMERASLSTLLMLLRGYIFVIPAFILLPAMMGDEGLWMAVPLSEALTLLVIGIAWKKMMR